MAVDRFLTGLAWTDDGLLEADGVPYGYDATMSRHKGVRARLVDGHDRRLMISGAGEVGPDIPYWVGELAVAGLAVATLVSCAGGPDGSGAHATPSIEPLGGYSPLVLGDLQAYAESVRAGPGVVNPVFSVDDGRSAIVAAENQQIAVVCGVDQDGKNCLELNPASARLLPNADNPNESDLWVFARDPQSTDRVILSGVADGVPDRVQMIVGGNFVEADVTEAERRQTPEAPKNNWRNWLERLGVVAKVAEAAVPTAIATATNAPPTEQPKPTATGPLPEATAGAAEGPKWGELAPIVKGEFVCADAAGKLCWGGKLMFAENGGRELYLETTRAFAESVYSNRKFMQDLLGTENPTRKLLEEYLMGTGSVLPLVSPGGIPLSCLIEQQKLYPVLKPCGEVYPSLVKLGGLRLDGGRLVVMGWKDWQKDMAGVQTYVKELEGISGSGIDALFGDPYGMRNIGYLVDPKDGRLVMVLVSKGPAPAGREQYNSTVLGGASGEFDLKEDPKKVAAYAMSMFKVMREINKSDWWGCVAPLYRDRDCRFGQMPGEELDSQKLFRAK